MIVPELKYMYLLRFFHSRKDPVLSPTQSTQSVPGKDKRYIN